MKRALAAIAVILTVGGCFGGCFAAPGPDTRVDMTPADLIGVWQEHRSGAELVFDADGTFNATNLPYQEFEKFHGVLPDGFDPQQDKLPGSGTWVLEPPIGNPDGPLTNVHLHVRTLAGRPDATGLDLRAERIGSAPVTLNFYIDDPDLNNKIVYEKCQTSCPAITPAHS